MKKTLLLSLLFFALANIISVNSVQSFNWIRTAAVVGATATVASAALGTTVAAKWINSTLTQKCPKTWKVTKKGLSAVTKLTGAGLICTGGFLNATLASSVINNFACQARTGAGELICKAICTSIMLPFFISGMYGVFKLGQSAINDIKK